MFLLQLFNINVFFFHRTWKLEVDSAKKGHRNPSLLRALIKIFGADYMLHGIIQCFQEIFLR